MQLELDLENLDNAESVREIGQRYEAKQLEKDFGFTGKVGRRRIPAPKNHYLVPVLRNRNISRKAQHLGVLWYMSALVPTAHTRPYFDNLKRFLEMEKWTTTIAGHVYTCLESATSKMAATK